MVEQGLYQLPVVCRHTVVCYTTTVSTVDDTPVTTVSEASEAFLAHLRFKRRSKRTIAQYEPVLRALNALMGGS